MLCVDGYIKLQKLRKRKMQFPMSVIVPGVCMILRSRWGGNFVRLRTVHYNRSFLSFKFIAFVVTCCKASKWISQNTLIIKIIIIAV